MAELFPLHSSTPPSPFLFDSRGIAGFPRPRGLNQLPSAHHTPSLAGMKSAMEASPDDVDKDAVKYRGDGEAGRWTWRRYCAIFVWAR